MFKTVMWIAAACAAVLVALAVSRNLNFDKPVEKAAEPPPVVEAAPPPPVVEGAGRAARAAEAGRAHARGTADPGRCGRHRHDHGRAGPADRSPSPQDLLEGEGQAPRHWRTRPVSTWTKLDTG